MDELRQKIIELIKILNNDNYFALIRETYQTKTKKDLLKLMNKIQKQIEAKKIQDLQETYEKGKATNPLEIQKTIEFILNHRTHDETDINHAEKLITTYPEYIKVKEAHNNSPEINLLLEQFKQVYINALPHLSNAQNNLLKYEFEACFSGMIQVERVQQLMEKSLMKAT